MQDVYNGYQKAFQERERTLIKGIERYSMFMLAQHTRFHRKENFSI